MQNIEPAELNKHLAYFIRSCGRKDGEDFEPSSLSLKTINKNLNLNMYVINTIAHGKCFVQYLRTHSLAAQISYAHTFHEVFSIYSYPYD